MSKVNFKNNKVYFFDLRKKQDGINSKGIIQELNSKVKKLLEEIFPVNGEQNAVIKTHVGEPLKRTHMKPELLTPYYEYLQENGVNDVVYGDTTVAYSGERGYKENPEDNAERYLKLVNTNGFTDIPFVVLDRPITKKGSLDFNIVHKEINIDNAKIRYKKIFPSGAFLKADIIINNAHLTGHPLAKNALCNKSVSMGLSSYAGKLQLHQNLYPEIDSKVCTLCGNCVEDCPANALSINSQKVELDFNLCIGCGQCASICPVKAMTMVSQGIETWNKGVDSIDVRMAEYTLAMLNEFPGKMLHVGHLYNITPGCDCLNQKESPKGKDIGITIGFNPFAVDFASTALENALKKGKDSVTDVSELLDFVKGKSRFEVYDYVKEKFGIDYIPDLEVIKI